MLRTHVTDASSGWNGDSPTVIGYQTSCLNGICFVLTCLWVAGVLTGVAAMGLREKQPLIHRIADAAFIVAFLPVIIPLVAAILALYWFHQLVLYALIWVLWLPRGKDVLLVYSDSPIWHDYITTQVLPLVQERAVILNWSQRNTWPRWSFSVHVFRSLGGREEFNPMVAVFRPFRRARLFRFWSAFKDWKRGYTEPVERLRSALLRIL